MDWADEIAKPFVDYDHFLNEEAAKRWQDRIATALRKAKADGIRAASEILRTTPDLVIHSKTTSIFNTLEAAASKLHPTE